MASSDLNILYLDNHLIVVFKPAGLLTQSDRTGEPALMDRVREWIKKEYNKTGNVFLGLVHRLDRPVAGVVLFARTSKAASRLSKQFREGTPAKTYRAVVRGVPKEKQATLVHYLRKEKSLKATVFPRETPDAKRAELSYEVTGSVGENATLKVMLATGRFHQIRAQLAFIGHPIAGDVKYGASDPLPGGRIALYAHQLVFDHPISGERTSITSPEPEGWAQLNT
ncbi:MAG: RluA family pseudouridine synthase [Nitrospinae bacterium]|nr:RluA family pseudouridine synthase [Nitrospinota bacterium]